MKIYEREQMLKNAGRKEGFEEIARIMFTNGVSYEIVRASIPSLTDEELKEIYERVAKRA